jgi:uncharacterized membrane protein YtjA (UPF0391 family)
VPPGTGFSKGRFGSGNRRNQFRVAKLASRKGVESRAKRQPIAELAMTILKWALIFLLISIVAGVLGFTGLSAASADVARFLFYVFVVIFLVLLILGLTIFRA